MIKVAVDARNPYTCMLATGKFSQARMLLVLVEEEMGGITYSIQYFTDSKQTLDAYYAEDADRLRGEAMNVFCR